MTLCIAAACRDGKDNPCIVVASDWKTEIGDMTGAEIQNKLYWLYNNSLPVLIAGTASDAQDVISTFRLKFNRKGITEANARDRIMEALLEYKKKFTEEYVQASANVSFEYFRDNKDKIDAALWSKVWGNIGRIKADCRLIFCSFAAGVPLMFQVDGDFPSLPADKLVLPEENFLTIGTGSIIANSMLCFRAQHSDLRLMETVYNIFEAMRFAHQANAPGVGRTHAFSVLSPTKNGRITAKRLKNAGQKFLREQYDVLGPKADSPKKVKIPKGIWERY